MEYTDTVLLGGVECDYDARSHTARVYCGSCAKANEVKVWVENDGPEYPGFVCSECGTFNSPQG